MTDLLLVYVHGFLGSTDSFHSFPQDLQKKISINNTFIIYPTYDTKGSNTKAIHALADWLLINATTLTAKSVILLGHSMGGLLAVDACNYLQTLNASSLVNIIGILSFDSPFFGLCSNLHKSSVRNIKEEIGKVQPKDLMPDSIHVPVSQNISVPISTEWISHKFSSLSSYVMVGGAAVAGVMSYSSIGISGLLYLGKKADQLTDHLRFLYPLSQTGEMTTRFEDLAKTLVYFHGFYLEISSNHFCTLAPYQYSDKFSSVSSDLNDEIQGHMYMFSQQKNSSEYINLLNKAFEHIHLLERLISKRLRSHE